MRKWLIFLVVIVLALGYGLGLRERAPEPAPVEQPATLTAPLYVPADSLVDSEESTLVRREAVLMGSQFIFVAEGPRAPTLAAIVAASERLRALEATLSSWKPGSEIYRLNDNGGKWIKLGADALALLQRAKTIHAETDGAFDVTIGALWDLYPFRDPLAPLPSAGQIAAALRHVGAERIEIDLATSRARLPAGMRVNLGGIGKGYAAQIAIETLRAHGIDNAAVSAGGDLYLLGGKQAGPWTVRIENPRWEGQSIEQFTLRDRSVATSGDGRRYLLRDGKRYSHIVDPRSGQLVQGVQSATVITDDPTLADAYATAVCVLGPQAGMRWVEARAGVEALIIDANGTVSRSSGWAAVTGGRR
ncbi:MAG: FAD:protein FMN transferase [Gammaproteobacteria bacterium]|nr:FAD:protein FMN transferase [Gammaproteobacteria bacterium]